MTDPILLSLLWYPLLGLFIWGLQRQTRCFTHWNLFTLLAGLLVLFHGVWVPWALEVNYESDGVQVSQATKLTFIANIMIAFYSILAGAWVANRTKRFRAASITDFPAPRDQPSGASPWRLIVAAVVMIAVGLYVDGMAMGGISLSDIIRGKVGAEQYKMARFLFNNSTSAEQGIIFYIARIMFISWMMLFIGFAYFLWQGGQRYGLALFLILSITFLNHSMMSGHKAPLAYYVLVVFAARAIARGQRNFKRLLPILIPLVLVMLFVFLPALFMLQYSHATYGEAVESALFRLCIEPNRCLMLYYDTYPERYDFTGIASIPLIARLLGLPIAIPAHTYIPMFEHGEIGQTWNTAFFGDAWVGFGWAGTLVFSLLVGYLLQRLNIWFERSRRSLLKTGLFVALIIAASRLSATSLPSALMTFGLGTYFVLYVLVKKRIEPREEHVFVIRNDSLSPQPMQVAPGLCRPARG